MELIRVRVQGSAAPAGVSYTQQLMSTVRSIHAQGEVGSSSYVGYLLLHDVMSFRKGAFPKWLQLLSVVVQDVYDADGLAGSNFTGDAHFAGSGPGQVPQLLARHGGHAGQGCSFCSCVLVSAGAFAVYHATKGCLCIYSTGAMPHSVG